MISFIRTFSVARFVLRVIPNIFRTLRNAILMKICITLNASLAIKLADALKTWFDAWQTRNLHVRICFNWAF